MEINPGKSTTPTPRGRRTVPTNTAPSVHLPQDTVSFGGRGTDPMLDQARKVSRTSWGASHQSPTLNPVVKRGMNHHMLELAEERKFKNWAPRAVKNLSSAYHLAEGTRKISRGDYLEGGLQMTAGGLDLAEVCYNGTKAGRGALSAFSPSGHRAITTGWPTKTVLKAPSKAARVLGPAAGVTFAAMDGVAAKKAFQAGDEVRGTERAMDSAWSLASIHPAAVPGAIAHSVTRLAMSTEVRGVSGDKLVTSGMDQVLNRGANQREVHSSARNQQALDSHLKTPQAQQLKSAAHNGKEFSRAITGLLDKISQEQDPEKLAVLKKHLRRMRETQREVSNFRNH